MAKQQASRPPSNRQPPPAAERAARAAGPTAQRQRAPSRGIKVRAKRPGYFGHERRRTGDVFYIQREQEFGSWMERVDDSVPERTTTPNEIIRQQHDEILQRRTVERGAGGVEGESEDAGLDGSHDDENPLGVD
jgi:hypothetical protein